LRAVHSLLAKNPWIAAVLNFMLYGLGYVYVGKRKVFGWILLLGHLVSFVTLGYSLEFPITTYPLSGAALAYSRLAIIGALILEAAFAYDAYQLAEEFNRESPGLSEQPRATRIPHLRPALWGLILFVVGIATVTIPIALTPIGSAGAIPAWVLAVVVTGSFITFLSIPIAVTGEIIRWYGKRKSKAPKQ
jgi:hypothetical protein